jgi:hypothetical protein
MSKRIKWISLALAALIVAIGILFYLGRDISSPTTEYTEVNTKLYTGNGYEVRYPGNWSLDPSGAVAGIVVFTDNSDLRSEIVIISMEEDAEKELRDAIDITKEERISISGTTGTLLTGANLESGGVEMVVFVKSQDNNKFYALIGSGEEFAIFMETFKMVE